MSKGVWGRQVRPTCDGRRSRLNVVGTPEKLLVLEPLESCDRRCPKLPSPDIFAFEMTEAYANGIATVDRPMFCATNHDNTIQSITITAEKLTPQQTTTEQTTTATSCNATSARHKSSFMFCSSTRPVALILRAQHNHIPPHHYSLHSLVLFSIVFCTN